MQLGQISDDFRNNTKVVEIITGKLGIQINIFGFNSREEAELALSLFPKTYRMHIGHLNCDGYGINYLNGGASLKSTKLTGDANEAGVARIEKIIKKAQAVLPDHKVVRYTAEYKY